MIGVPDPDRGELVKAIIQLCPGIQGSDRLVAELQEWVRSKLAPYKYPRQIEFIDDLPMDPTGKVPYGKLRERELARLARRDPALAK